MEWSSDVKLSSIRQAAEWTQTCQACIDERTLSKLLPRPALPMQSRTAHCSNTRTDPGVTNLWLHFNKYNEPATHDSSYDHTAYTVVRLTPRPLAPGSRFSSGTMTSSIAICPVTLARNENLPSITGADRPFIPRSNRKPLTLLSWASDFAHTMKTSAIGEFVILTKRTHEYFKISRNYLFRK